MTVVNPESARVNPELSRRQRNHRATKSDLVAAARALLVSQGVDAVTVRSIAADLGMTAPAVYRYFDSRESLLEDVIDLLYNEIADYLTAAGEAERNGPITDRFLGAARAFRSWALTHRAEFSVLFGAPIPGVHRKGEDLCRDGREPAGEDRGMRFAMLWLTLFAEINSEGIDLPPWPRPIPAALRAQLRDYTDRIGRMVDVELAMLFLYCWQRLYGFICTEVFGHLTFALDDCTEMFEDQLAELRDRLHLP